jgi:hypothetical protein
MALPDSVWVSGRHEEGPAEPPSCATRIEQPALLRHVGSTALRVAAASAAELAVSPGRTETRLKQSSPSAAAPVARRTAPAREVRRPRLGDSRSRPLHPPAKPSGQGNRDLAGEVREAMNESPHVCARARVGERPVSSLMCSAAAHARPGRPTDRNPPYSDMGVRDARTNEHHVCARRRYVRRQDWGSRSQSSRLLWPWLEEMRAKVRPWRQSSSKKPWLTAAPSMLLIVPRSVF